MRGRFNYAHRKLYNRLLQLGAQPVFERGESDEQHPEGIDGSFIPWSLSLRTRLLDLYPLPIGLDAIPEDVQLDPKWKLEFASGASASREAPPVQQSAEGDIPSDDLVPVNDAITVLLEKNERLTPQSHWQDVRQLALSTPDKHSYTPGDTLTIYPKNFPSDVSLLLSSLGWAAVADTPLALLPVKATSTLHSPSPLRHLDLTNTTVTLRWLFTNVLDILSIPRRSFFARLAHYCDDEFQKERLLEFTNPEYIDELYDYTTRPRRSILEVLQEFDTVRVPWERVLDVIPIMRGRMFSLASGGMLKRPMAGTNVEGTKFELLVAIVKYRTVIKRIRQGVCTRYIASLQAGQQLNVRLQKGGLGIVKSKEGVGKKPVVMVAPGTGVAPMRSLIYEQQDWNVQFEKDSGNDVLFFGCRNAESDFFFRDEWTVFEERGLLDVHVAFSRDEVSSSVEDHGTIANKIQRQKVYVQDLIRQQSQKVYSALGTKGGIVFVCGSSGKMPQAIREALIEVFQKEGGFARQQAEAYLVKMEKDGRYKQETW